MSPPDSRPDRPRLRPISGRAVALSAVIGLVAGWGIHPLFVRLGGHPPLVSWVQAFALLIMGVLVGVVAWRTWLTVQIRGERLESYEAVNRLALARSCILAGAVVGAGYVGYAVSWLGDDSRLADQWILRSLVAAGGALVLMIASLVLERACRADVGDDHL